MKRVGKEVCQERIECQGETDLQTAGNRKGCQESETTSENGSRENSIIRKECREKEMSKRKSSKS